MSRFFHFGALALALAFLPAVAQNSTTSARGRATVERVIVHEHAGAPEVEIQTSGAPISPDTQSITGPDRIVVDFPGAVPSRGLHVLKVNRGVLKGVRCGLFFDNPPIARIVLDLSGPQSYRISTDGRTTVVRLEAPGASQAASVRESGAHLTDAVMAHSTGLKAPAPRLSEANALGQSHAFTGSNASTGANRVAASAIPRKSLGPAEPRLLVLYENGMLSIHADKVTLSQVLYEVHLRTQADIPIPAGAEQEQVVADLGPGAARDVLAALLNGSAYNFIFVGSEDALERVILTRRDTSH